MALLLGACGALLPGCGRRPSELCWEYVNNWQAAIDRCDIIDSRTGMRLEFVILHPDPPHDPVSCDNIGQVNNVPELSGTCYPWLRSAPCAEVLDVLTGAASMPACEASHFEILVAR